MSYNPWYSNNQTYTQKNLLELKQDQEYSYGVMGNVFSALECFANKSSPEKTPLNNFGYYNNFNSGNLKDKNQLKDQIITQLEIFKYSYLMYIKDHNEYHFPKNMKKEEIIKIIEKMKEYVDEVDKKYYNAILQIIDSKNVSYINETINKSLSKGVNPNYANQGFIIGDGGMATTISLKLGEEIQRKYNNNPNYEPQLNLNQSSPNPLPKTSKQREMDDLIDELIQQYNQLVKKKSYNDYSLTQNIEDNLKKFQMLHSQFKPYYYNVRDLKMYIKTFESEINFRCTDKNKVLLKMFCLILKDISPNIYN